jgi:asparagine synthase (glutamine-hydrolysing)
VCGIVAAFGRVDAAKCERMLDRVRHRGPDDTGVLALPTSWLGHQRLSIIDVMGGHQPLTDADETTWIVGNGEIYNHERLTADLPDGVLQTKSDTEAALHMVMIEGPAAVARLNGRVAIAMVDDVGGGLVARDPVGVKPLYWVTDDETTLFASELRAFDAEDRSRVEAFPPGCLWTPAAGVVRYADAIPVEVRPARRAQTDLWDNVVLDQVRDAVIAAVRRRMMSDVGVGVFLSGGLDSAIVAAIAAQEVAPTGELLPTFAVGTVDSADLAAARKVAAHIGSDHHEIVVTPADLSDALDEAVTVIEHFDPRLVRSAVPNLLLAREAAKQVKVVLTGEGADELFAGYTHQHTAEFADPDALHGELVRSVEQLHGLNLQRCDRTTMYYGLEAREPFLDSALVRTAMRLPPEWKQRTGGRQEKAILREAFRDWLPDELLWRDKEQFGDGSGAGTVLAALAAERVDRSDLEDVPQVPPDCWPLRSEEEVMYYDLWADRFAGIRPLATLEPFATA